MIWVGIVLAFVGVIVYITRSWVGAQKEKATSDGMSKVALDRVQQLEKEQLRHEYEQRKIERDAEEHFTPVTPVDRTIGFWVRKDKDGNDTN